MVIVHARGVSMAKVFQSSSVGVSMDVPPTQNTAPVLEYRCLYTPDLRRKQKRWQDGRLKFHTFNKRIMVYDERANFVGDAHYQDDYEFGEGVELRLDRGGVLVEVGECIGVKEQDLGELVDKRLKEREERAAAKTAAASPLAYSVRNGGFHAPVLQPKSLNSILASNSYSIRAGTSGLSPFEARQQPAMGNIRGHENERPAKRRRQDDLTSSQKGYAQALTGATLSLSSQKPSHVPMVRYERVTARLSVNSEPTSTAFDGRREGNLGFGQNAVTEGVLPELPRSSTKKRIQKSPPRRNGYAANLTGVELSLSKPESLPPNPTHKGRGPERLQSVEARSELQTLSNLVDGRSLVETVRPSRNDGRPAERIIQNLPTKALLLSRSSSPDLNSRRPRTLPAQQNPLQTASPSSPINAVPRKPPVSSLTIKARPPRQLMMLMQPPSSLSRASSNVHHKSQTLANRACHEKVQSDGMALSQATANLDAFCQKQDKRLSARLIRSRPPILPQDREARSPTPVSIGSASQVSCRNTRGTEKDKFMALTPAASPSLSRASLEGEKAETQIAESQSQVEGDTVHNTLRIVERGASQPDDIVSERTNSFEEPPLSPRKTIRNSIRPSSPTAIGGGIQLATRHFRDIIASAPYSFGQAQDVDSQSPDSRYHGMQNYAAKTQPTALDLDSNQKMLRPQASTTGTLQAEDSILADRESSPVFDSTGISDLFASQTQTGDNQSLEETKPRLVNPATRGRTLQTLTSFIPVEIPAPAANLIGMPPPFAAQRRETRNPRRRDIIAAAGEATTAPGDIGPWSRESFDLFGNWRESNLREQNPVAGQTNVPTVVTT